MNSEKIIRQFWQLMASNDFNSVLSVLAPDFVLEWPQSSERIRGAARFVQMNVEYPANGTWVFTINRIVAGADGVVSDVFITDGVQKARAISFFTINNNGLISSLVEFWPEPYAAPENRAHLTEPIV